MERDAFTSNEMGRAFTSMGRNFGVALEKMMVMSGLVLVRNLMMQTKFYRHAYTN